MRGSLIGRSGHVRQPGVAILGASAVPVSSRRRIVVAALGATVAILTVVAPVGAATPQQDVHIVAPMSKQGYGTFEATGPAVESGLVCERGTVLGVRGFNVGWQSGQKVQAISTVELTCADGSGSFLISRQIHVVFGGDEPFNWVALGGTGDYEGLAGRGSGVTADNTETSNTNIYDGFLLP